MSTKSKEKEDKKHFERDSVLINFAQLSSMMIKDLEDNKQPLVKKYTKEDVKRFLDNPKRNAKALADLSQGLYRASPHYRRIINYFANMPTLDYLIEPYNINLDKINEKSFATAYERANNMIELMNIKHEFQKILKVAWTNDTFYGYEHEAKDSYFIQRLPNEFCQVSSIEDGVYNFAFHFKYFDTFPKHLDFFPKEFKKLYNKYKNGTEGEWIELDPTKTICIKINEHLDYDLPPFVSVFGSIFDIEDYKALKKASETIQNYKFIVQKIPVREDSGINNDFIIDLPNVSMFHNKVAGTIPEEIGLLTVPFETETIDFTSNRDEKNKVEQAERDFYSSVGTSSLLFNGDNSSQANLSKSVMVDEQEVFSVLRQLERWVNRKLKVAVKGNLNFKLTFMDLTVFNRKEYIETLLKSAQYGLPVKLMLCSALGLSPASVKNLTYLENKFLNLVEEFEPLQSSHTQSGKAEASGSGNDESGRPTKQEDELTEKGEEQIARDDNANKE